MADAAPAALHATVALHAALSDPGRVRALLVLRDRELCLCQLVELLQLNASTVSRHMGQLRRAGLVEARREGKWTWFRRSAAPDTMTAGILEGLDAALGDQEQAETDRARIEEIVRRLPGPCAP